jgi:hypothetical protein
MTFCNASVKKQRNMCRATCTIDIKVLKYLQWLQVERTIPLTLAGCVKCSQTLLFLRRFTLCSCSSSSHSSSSCSSSVDKLMRDCWECWECWERLVDISSGIVQPRSASALEVALLQHFPAGSETKVWGCCSPFGCP